MPMCHPFEIASKQRSEIAVTIARAVANISDRLGWADSPNGLVVFQQQMAEQTIRMPFGFSLAYDVTFSVAKVDGTLERCLNIAVPHDLHKPFPVEAEMIAQAFGFLGEVKDWRVFKVAHEVGQESFTITLTQPATEGKPLPKRLPPSRNEADATPRERRVGKPGHGKALDRPGRSAKLG